MASQGLEFEDEDEDNKRLTKELEDFGVSPEEAFTMDLKGKQELLAVCKLSESTAQEEDEERKRFQCDSQDVAATTDDDLTQLELQGSTISSSSKFAVQGIIARHQFASSHGSEIVPTSSQKENSGPKLVVIKEFSRTPSTKISNKSKEMRPEKYESAHSLFNRPPANDDEFDQLLSVDSKKINKDRIRNIDVWNCVKDPNEKTFDKKIHGVKYNRRIPFHFQLLDLDHDDYIVKFKEHVNVQSIAHYEQQWQSVRFIPWGKPILSGTGARAEKHVGLPVNNIPVQSIDEDTDSHPPNLYPSTSHNSYNLRRGASTLGIMKRQPSFAFPRDDHISSDEENIISSKRRKNGNDENWLASVNEEDSRLQPPLIKPSSGYTRTCHNFDFDEDDKELTTGEAERAGQTSANKNIKLRSGNSSTCSDTIVDDDSDEDFVPAGKETLNPKTKLNFSSDAVSNKRKRGPNKKPSKKINKPSKTEKEESLWLTTISSPIEIKPQPITGLSKTTHKRLMTSNLPLGQSTASQFRRRSELKFDDQLIAEQLDDTNGDTGEVATAVCPLCSETFSANEIQDHANMCCDEDSQLQIGDLGVEKVGDECTLCFKRFSEVNFQAHAAECIARKNARRIIPGARGGSSSRK